LSYQHRLSLGILMAESIDASTEQIPSLQSIYPTPQPAVMPGKGGHKSMTPGNQKSLSDSYLTTSQKAMQGA
jgi:hypothetical protein